METRIEMHENHEKHEVMKQMEAQGMMIMMSDAHQDGIV